MLSTEANQRLTQVGPGTPMGNLLRRYWYPLAASSEVTDRPIRRRLLGEDLVIYRRADNAVAVIEEFCPHRRVSLAYGIIESNGIRCPYHGWLFSADGQCLEQPAEPPESTFKDRIKAQTYPAQELGGMIHVYLGPDPAPILPRFDLYTWDNVWREVWVADLPHSWLAAMENSVDPHHVEWLHGRLAHYVRSRDNSGPLPEIYVKRHQKVGFDEFEWGIIKRRILEGGSEEDDDWKIGHPLVFPFTLRRGFAWLQQFQIRIPIDDEHTRHFWYTAYRPPVGLDLPPQEKIPFTVIPYRQEDGDYIIDYVDGQDVMAWSTSGPILDRSREHLGQSDLGVIMLRRMFQREMKKVEDGLDPIGVIRDPDRDVVIDLPTERKKLGGGHAYWREAIEQGTHRYSPLTPSIVEQFERFEAYEREREASGVR